LTAYFAQHGTLGVSALGAAAFAALISQTQRQLSNARAHHSSTDLVD